MLYKWRYYMNTVRKIGLTPRIVCLIVFTTMLISGNFMATFRSPLDFTRFRICPENQSLIPATWIGEMHSWSNLKGPDSQGAQDYYLKRIFEVIGETNRYFVEFGFNEVNYSSGGSGANTKQLYRIGWRGLLLDGERENLEINLRRHYLFANNIADIFRLYDVPEEMDYLSVDMDSHDLWVFRAILAAGYRPRVMTTEYNGNYPLSAAITLIDPTLIGDGTVPPGFSFKWADCAWGTSAKALRLVATQYGYTMIGRVAHLDLVWLRNDLIDPCHQVPEFEWFFHNQPSLGRLGSMRYHRRQQNTNALGRLVDYEAFAETGDFAAGNLAARAILKRLNLKCFRDIYDKI